MEREKLYRLLRLGIEKGASDIHLQVGYLPLYRFHGELVELRYKVLTPTDTEAIAHLVEEAYAGDLSLAVRTALRRAHGAYALAVLHRGEPDRVVGARMNVPLIVGLGEGAPLGRGEWKSVLVEEVVDDLDGPGKFKHLFRFSL